jgi:hypothetical protein
MYPDLEGRSNNPMQRKNGPMKKEQNRKNRNGKGSGRVGLKEAPVTRVDAVFKPQHRFCLFYRTDRSIGRKILLPGKRKRVKR